MDSKPSLGESKPYKLVPTISLAKYSPDERDIRRLMGTEDVVEQRDHSWLNITGQGGSDDGSQVR